MMKRISTIRTGILFAALLLGPATLPARAQRASLPDDVDRNMQLFVGAWEGSRTIVDPNGSRMESPVSLIAFRILENTAVELRDERGGGNTLPEATTMLAWDNEMQKMIMFTVNSLPTTYYSEGQWTEDATPTLSMRLLKWSGGTQVEMDDTYSFPDPETMLRKGTITLHKATGKVELTLEATLKKKH